MKDGIIKGTGDSRYLKGAGWPATYAEFKAMAEAGTLPFDLNGINEAGWQQIGDALNKGNLLTDATAAKYIATPTGAETVNQLLSLLGASLLKDGNAVKDTLGNLITIPSAQLDFRVQAIAGSYIGTETYGPSNPISLALPIDAKYLLIIAKSAAFPSDCVQLVFNIPNLTGSYQSCGYSLLGIASGVGNVTSQAFYPAYCYARKIGNTISFYYTGGAYPILQANSAATNRWVAIG